MTTIGITLTLDYPDSMDSPPVLVALSQLLRALEAFEDVDVVSAEARSL